MRQVVLLVRQVVLVLLLLQGVKYAPRVSTVFLVLQAAPLVRAVNFVQLALVVVQPALGVNTLLQALSGAVFLAQWVNFPQ